jgi:dienelactone hydrolase
LLCPVLANGQVAGPVALGPGDEFAAKDTLACGDDAGEDARACLVNLSWRPAAFAVHLEAAQPGQGDWLVRFPSARPIGNSTNDLVSMEWYAARDEHGKIRRARAIVVVHESGRRMPVGRLIARGLGGQGLHAFLIHLPGYGPRRVEGSSDLKLVLPALQQGIADVRRARDAVAALPVVDASAVGVQGTSLGGFVTATVAGLDRGYDRVFIVLAGGNLHEVVLHGARDAAKTREKLAAAGVTEQQIKDLAREVEPLRLAHRIDAAGTWLYSGKYDDVVPPACSLALVKAAHLAEGHHIELAADHYSGIIYLPQVIKQIADHMAAPIAENRRNESVGAAP